MKKIYHTEVVNDQGLKGTAYTRGEHELAVVTSRPTSTEAGTNPEQLIGLSWATCFNSTIEILLKSKGIEKKSRVEVHIDYCEDENTKEHFFELKAYAAIDGIDLDEASSYIDTAAKRCPVSKIIGDYPYASYEVIPYSE
ncbi:dihydroneopterin aldolase [Tetragenococcus halophilus subsp. flandriensis]|uniref:OsmC family protein n=1 Tax=Tetragenococcus halophilus TaxID=51669 RepID=A0AB35HM55_TETHA|nr:OsmC family protein [Tetragenococcus halophilus]MCO8296862.1 OsmC family protein [Tetragenococcus halophilus]GMA09505.1 dihydroneopterin aldolase [Tetragenococcus halophilus subsp. flandriensis]